jgi:hypothetical protein
MVFSAAQMGQVNRITYPDRVPEISGLVDCDVIVVLFPDFLDSPGPLKRPGAPYTKSFAGKRREDVPCPAVPGNTNAKTVYDYLV